MVGSVSSRTPSTPPRINQDPEVQAPTTDAAQKAEGSQKTAAPSGKAAAPPADKSTKLEPKPKESHVGGAAGTAPASMARGKKPAAAGPAAGERYLKGDLDATHVEHMATLIKTGNPKGVGEGKNEEMKALDALAITRDPSKTDTVGPEKQPTAGTPEAAKERQAGLTSKEFNAVLTDVLKDPKAAAAVVERASGNTEILYRVAQQGTDQTKEAFAKAVLSDPKLSGTRKEEMLATVITTPKQMESLLKSASPEQRELIAAMIPKHPEIGKLVAGTSTEAQMGLARTVMESKSFKPEQRTQILRPMLEGASKETFNALLDPKKSGASADEIRQFSAIIAGSEPLLRRAGQQLSPQNQQRVVEEMLTLPLSKGDVGSRLSLMLGNMSGKDKDSLLDFMQKGGNKGSSDLWPAFLETQIYMPIAKTLLPGISPANAKQIASGMGDLMKDVERDKHVADPDAIGRMVSKSDAKTYQEAKTHQTSSGTSTSETNQATQGYSDAFQAGAKVGVKVGAKGGVDIPFLAKAEMSAEISGEASAQRTVTDSWQYSNQKQAGSSTGVSDTTTSGSSLTQTGTATTNDQARAEYERDAAKGDLMTAIDRARRQVTTWAEDKYPGQYSKAPDF
jgi:hypothetical protein